MSGGHGADGETFGPGDDSVGRDDEASELPNLAVRAVQVFASPGKLFAQLRERPVWLGALLLVVALSVATSLLFPEGLFRDAFMAGVPEGTDPSDVEGQLEFFLTFRHVMSAVIPPIVIVALAGLLLFVFNLLLGGEGGFRQLLSASAHAMLITTVGGLLTLPLMEASGDVQTALALHLLVPGLEEGYLFRFLRGLNVFSLWTAVVLGVAVSRIYPARSLGGAAGTLIGLYVAMKAVFALFGGMV